MKSNPILLSAVFLFGIAAVKAQEKTTLSLNEAVNIALSKSDEVNLANSKVNTKSYEVQSMKMNQYPDFKVSGQYLRLTNADIRLKSSQESAEPADPDAETTASPKVNQLILAQANVTMPIFSGFKLKNSIKASENLYNSELANASYSKEQTAMRVVQFYADLYKAQKSVELFKESLKSSQQRVTDFTAMEQNGIIARNDLLKAKLQVSNVQLSLAEAEKNVRLVNYYLVTLLKLSPDTQIVVSPDNVDANLFNNAIKTESEALESRKDLEALRFAEKATEANIKIAQSNYYPSVSLIAGYTMLDLQNVVRVENAMNVGVGLSYNLSSIFKNGKEVKVAKSRFEEIQHQEAILTDHIKAEMVMARENYELSVKQDQVYTEAVDQASENYRIVKDKYDNGLSDTNDLLEADVDALSTKINQAYAKANVVLKYYELLEAAGQLTQSFNTTNN
ncbi:MAG: TolC family protein [Flavobacterium sp.]|nr:MAG: TolC family protein [Flavobacterium sp.]